MKYRTPVTILCFVLCLGTAAAQEETFTGTVTTTEQTEPPLEQAEQTELWTARKARATSYRAQVLATKKGMQLFADYQNAYIRNRLEHAVDCRESIRKSNKLGRYTVTARCYRTALLLEREFWQKHIQQAENLPGLTPEVRTETVNALSEIIDAIDTIILGIDSNVYTDEEGLLEAKYSLHSRYRAPVYLTLSKMRADRTLTWISHFMVRMLYLIETEVVEEDTFQKLQQALYCLEIGEVFMEEILTEEDYKKANLLLSQSLQHLLSCSPYLREGYELHNS